jgi:hypothetical protein
MSGALDEIMDFVVDTGERAVFVHRDQPLIVMNFSAFRALTNMDRQKVSSVSLTGEELLSRINREIAFWKQGQDARSANGVDSERPCDILDAPVSQEAGQCTEIRYAST